MADVDEQTVHEPAPRRGRIRRVFEFLRRHHRGVGAVIVTAAVFAGGTLAGWTLRDQRADPIVDASVSVTVDRPIVEAAGNDVRQGAPNVLGLVPDDARQALVDAGADPTLVDVVDVPSAGPAGVVVTQDPSPGIPVTAGVTLGISVAAKVPNLVGKDIDAARDALEALGAQISVSRRYDPTAKEGTVLAVDPAPGEALTVATALVVASAPSSVYLSSIDAVDSNCRPATEASVNGREHANALSCSVDSFGDETPSRSVWLLDRRIISFEATVGQDDESEPSIPVRFVFFGDGTVLAEGTAGYGESVPVAFDTGGVLRLELLVIEGSERDSSAPRPTFVVGEPLLVGGPDDVDALLVADT